MNDNTRNEFAAYGLEILKYAVPDALYKERANRWKGLLRIRISEGLAFLSLVNMKLATPI